MKFLAKLVWMTGINTMTLTFAIEATARGERVFWCVLLMASFTLTDAKVFKWGES